jgi:hypothetical protein
MRLHENDFPLSFLKQKFNRLGEQATISLHAAQSAA